MAVTVTLRVRWVFLRRGDQAPPPIPSDERIGCVGAQLPAA
jgi:hypothetical protein